MLAIPEVVLSSGWKIPILGFGTYASPRAEPETVKLAVLEAIKLGYRHFDTAVPYQTEQPLGEAIAESLNLGLVRSRHDLFITSKLWCSDAHRQHVIPALNKSLKNLRMEYVDLYLVHWPVSSKPGTYDYPIKKEDLVAMDFESVWAEMEECQRLGLTRSIGVSNFSCKKLSLILEKAKIPPAVNQVEMNPFWQQRKLLEFCRARGIILSAYAPLRTPRSSNNNRLTECNIIQEISEKKGKTLAQVCLRWIYEQGACILVKSFNKERMSENIDIFNWELSEEENKRLNEIPQTRGFLGEDFISTNGPIRATEELWDGEL
ncbi:NADP-dependent oxidoreductase domain [Dillenia turbinata]|uniref:NADP-dependent oxidoreductase domain n=1 Tax=Dillenia turbinata TaxID=194707 RepID=A0AAN8UWP6_9MAGN